MFRQEWHVSNNFAPIPAHFFCDIKSSNKFPWKLTPGIEVMLHQAHCLTPTYAVYKYAAMFRSQFNFVTVSFGPLLEHPCYLLPKLWLPYHYTALASWPCMLLLRHGPVHSVTNPGIPRFLSKSELAFFVSLNNDYSILTVHKKLLTENDYITIWNSRNLVP